MHKRTWRRVLCRALAVVGILAGVALPLVVSAAPAPLAPDPVERTSVGDGFPGAEVPDDSTWMSMSANGRFVAFATDASLSAIDLNDVTDVYVRDRVTGNTELITIGPVAVVGTLDCQPDSITFTGMTPVGSTSGGELVTCTATGGGVTISDIAIEPSTDFIVEDSGNTCFAATLSAGASCQFEVKHQPTKPGVHQATVNVSHDGANASPETVALSAAATDPGSLSCSPNPQQFSSFNGGGDTQNVTCTASGGALTIGTVSDSGPDATSFSESTNCNGLTLSSGGSCTIVVTFSGSASRDYTATLIVPHSGANGTQTVTLNGTNTNVSFQRFGAAQEASLQPAVAAPVSPQFLAESVVVAPAAPIVIAAAPENDDVTCVPEAFLTCVAVGGDHPSISDDGRFIAFDSNSSAYDNDDVVDVYIADRGVPNPDGSFASADPTIRQVSLFWNPSDGSYNFERETPQAFLPSISGDSSQVAFFCDFDCVDDPPDEIGTDAKSALIAIRNLDSDDDGTRDDPTTSFVLADTNGDGVVTNAPSGYGGNSGTREYAQADSSTPPAMSGNGEHVAFAQWIDPDPETDGFDIEAIAVYDRDGDGDGLMGDRDIACDPQFFASDCSGDPAPHDNVGDEVGAGATANETRTVYVSFDTVAAGTYLSTVGPDPVNSDYTHTDSYEPAISGNGSTVAWRFCSSCSAGDLSADGVRGAGAAHIQAAALPADDQVVVAVRGGDGKATKAIYASVDDSSDCPTLSGSHCPGDGDSSEPALSDDGRFVAFTTEAPSLIGGAGSIPTQIVRADLGPTSDPGYPLVQHLVAFSVGDAEGTNPECNGSRELGGESSFRPELTEDGQGAGFMSNAENLLGWTDDGSGGCKTVDGNDNGDNITGTDAFLLVLAPQNSSISVEKSATPGSRPEPGGEFTFDVVVTNTGELETTISSLVDDIYGDLTTRPDSSCDTAPGTKLAPNDSYTCAFTVQFTGNAGAEQTDTITATASDAFEPATGTGSATITITDVAPTITVQKSVDPSSRPAPGGSFTFTALVTNTSHEAVTLTALTDDVYGNLSGKGTCATGASLAADGDTFSCSFTANVEGVAGSTHTDTITATAVDDDGTSASASDDATMTLTSPPPTTVTPPSDVGPSSQDRGLARTGAGFFGELRLGIMLMTGGSLLVGGSRSLRPRGRHRVKRGRRRPAHMAPRTRRRRA